MHLFLLQSFGLTQSLTWNDASWSIAVEFWTYVAFAAIAPIFRHRLDAVLIAVAVLCPLILAIVTPWGINVTFDWGIVRCFYGFALGALCWTVWQRGDDAVPGHRFAWTVAEIAVAVLVGAFIVVSSSSRWNLLGPPLFAVAVLVFARENGLVSRALSLRPMLFLGTLSYSIYMIHGFMQARIDNFLKLIERLIGTPLTTTVLHNGHPMMVAGATPAEGTALTIAMLVCVVGTSYLTYRFVERPAQNWSRAFIRNRAASPAHSAARLRTARIDDRT